MAERKQLFKTNKILNKEKKNHIQERKLTLCADEWSEREIDTTAVPHQ